MPSAALGSCRYPGLPLISSFMNDIRLVEADAAGAGRQAALHFISSATQRSRAAPTCQERARENSTDTQRGRTGGEDGRICWTRREG